MKTKACIVMDTAYQLRHSMLCENFPTAYEYSSDITDLQDMRLKLRVGSGRNARGCTT
jgi:hypothetical protein